MLFKNTASQRVRVFAFDSTTGAPKSGDAANVTGYIAKDYGSVTALGDTSATEEDATNAKGYYWLDITQTETNADNIMVTGKSSTSNIVVVGAPAMIATRPPNAGALSIDSSGRVNVIKINDVSASSVTTINANIGTTQALTFNANNFLKISLNDILATTLTETSGQIAGGFKKFFNIATPAATMDHLVLIDTCTTATGVTTVNGLAANVITATSIAADAITDAKVAADVTIASVTGAVGSVTGAVGSVTGNVGGNVTGSVGSIATGGIAAASFAAGAIDNAAIATDAIGSAELAASAVTEIQTGLSTLDAAGVRTAVGLAIANLDTQLGAIAGYVDTEVAAIKAKTDNLPASPAAVGSQMTFDMTQAIGSSQTSGTTGAALLGMEAQAVGKWTIVGTTLTIYRADGTTVVRTFTLDSATAPTSRT